MDYAAGILGEGLRLAIATHLVLNNQSRVLVTELAEAANALLSELPASQLPDTLKARSFTALKDHNQKYIETEECAVTDAACAVQPLFPSPLRAYLPPDIENINWQPLARGIEHYPLALQDNAKVQLIRVQAGCKIPAHTHTGLELAVILEGKIYDGRQQWQRGDIAIADQQTHHQPYTNGESCLCLLVTEGPLRFTGIAGQLYNRFRRVHHST